ncbi:MAG: [protein-PII] uridylyltransferase [Nitrospinae bacterium]|nr:[protein-PII] uridylyltransferase [Nitrospinota bacterium]
MEFSDTAAVKQYMDQRRAAIRAMHDRGAGGIEVCRALCDVVDHVITGLFRAVSGKFEGAVVALGGYGRGLLNPYSDVDLLFLLRDNHKKSMPPPEMLARLWDLGMKVGHSARSVSDTVTMGLGDITARTAMIECRFLAGNAELYDEFRKQYARKVIHYKPDNFIRAKMAEMEKRHLAFGSAVRLTEPDLKESRGGLRDFHTALWVIKSKLDVPSLQEMAARGLMALDEVEPVENAHSTLLRIRNGVHFRAGKAADRLVHAIQPDVARAEGFTQGSDNEAAAMLMRKYYNSALTVDRFATEMIQMATDYKRRRFWAPRIKIDADGLFASEGKLYANGFPPAQYGPEPDILLKIGARLAEEGLEPSPHLFRGLKKIASGGPDSWFAGENGGVLLMGILKLRHSFRAVSLFHDAGILQRLIPEFSDITGLSQFDMFHRYSTDEHTLTALRKLEDIPHSAPVCPQMKDIYRAKKDPEIIKLALLLHDLGKRAEDRHAVEEDTRSRPILERLGLQAEVEAVGFLVQNHLLMSTTAQRRDFSVPGTLRHFVETVKDRVNLRKLYLLTYADIAAVGPDVWNDWKDRLLCELYESALQYFIEGETMFLSSAEQLKALTIQSALAMGSKTFEPDAAAFLARAPERYIRQTEPETVALDIRQVERLRSARVALRFAPNPGDQTGKVTLAAQERIGFFSVISGAFAAKNISIVEAQIHTLAGHTALDTLTVSGNLSLIAEPNSLARFEVELADLLEGKKDLTEMVARRTKYLKQEPVAGPALQEPQIIVLNHLSETNSVVEIWAPDRIGLLYDITRTFARLNYDITSAKISTEGPTAINVFYVTSAEGGKIEEESAKTALSGALIHAITSPMGEG